MLINVQKIEKYYGDRLIFSLETLKVFRGDRIGIVGANGAGKSTLMRVLTGLLPPEIGFVDVRCQIAFVEQLTTNERLLDEPSGLYSGIFSVDERAKSGGEIMRKKLAAAFSTSFDILALDEPTSNLDLDGIEVLNSMLTSVDTLILISHDRSLLDSQCNKIIEVDEGSATVFSCGYFDYQQLLEGKKERQKVLYEEYVRQKRRLERSIRDVSEKAAKIKKAPSRMGNSEARLHRREASAKQAKVMQASNSMKSRLERIEKIEKPKEIRLIKPDFSLTNPPQNKIVLSCKDLTFSYESGLEEGDEKKLIFEHGQFEIFNGSHVGIVGGNGCGKTTLMELINSGFEGIYAVPKAKLGYMSQNFSNLDCKKSILENVLDGAVQSQTICRNVLAQMGFRGDDVHKNIGILSGGERIKTAISKLIASDCNILMLDEPTNYLDINSIVQIQEALIAYEGTIIFVSHDESFIDAVATDILQIVDKKIIKVR